MANSKVKNLNVIKETLSSIINETQFSLNAFFVFKYLTYNSFFQFQKLFHVLRQLEIIIFQSTCKKIVDCVILRILCLHHILMLSDLST